MREAWAAAREHLAGSFDLLVLDEITYPMNWGWIDPDEVSASITSRTPTTSVICTGRDAPAALIDLADTITEMVEVRHAYQRGIRAKRGIDY